VDRIVNYYPHTYLSTPTPRIQQFFQHTRGLLTPFKTLTYPLIHQIHIDNNNNLSIILFLLLLN